MTLNADEIEALLSNDRAAERESAARRAGQLGSAIFLAQLEALARTDPAQRVRREAASAIGRLARELPEAFAMLTGLASHDDPGVVLQAARGLISAANDCARRAIAEPILNRLAEHKNEVVRDFVAVERCRAHPCHNGGGTRQCCLGWRTGWSTATSVSCSAACPTKAST